MRLFDIQKILSDNIDHLILKALPLGNGTTKISSHRKTIESLENISKIEYFSDLIYNLKEITEIYNSHEEDLTIDSNIVSEFEDNLSSVKNRGIELLII